MDFYDYIFRHTHTHSQSEQNSIIVFLTIKICRSYIKYKVVFWHEWLNMKACNTCNRQWKNHLHGHTNGKQRMNHLCRIHIHLNCWKFHDQITLFFSLFEPYGEKKNNNNTNRTTTYSIWAVKDWCENVECVALSRHFLC